MKGSIWPPEFERILNGESAAIARVPGLKMRL